MTEDQLKELVARQKTLAEQLQGDITYTKEDAFKELDGLNKDLFIQQINNEQALLGALSVRIGLNYHAVQKDRETTKTEETVNEETASKEKADPSK